MKISECNHLRIRDTNDYGADVEQLIKSIEQQYSIDFRSLPQWKDLLKRLHVTTTDYQRKIQEANCRKYMMMSKIFIEATRYSPFELTEKLARTKDKWQMLNAARKKSRSSLPSEPDIKISSHGVEMIGEISKNSSAIHNNTEIPDILLPMKSDVETETRISDINISNLPGKICTNLHKLISPLQSGEALIKFKPTQGHLNAHEFDNDSKEWLLLNVTTSVKCFPRELFITSASLNEQTIKFSIINNSSEYMHIRFMRVTENEPFKRVKVIPKIPKILYPGIEIKYKFIFKLFQNLENFTSMLYFRVGKKVVEEAPVEGLCIPIICKFEKLRSVLVRKVVNISPAYLWQVRESTGFPSGTLKISGNDEYSYHVHIYKRLLDISRECQDSDVSINAISLTTKSAIEIIDDKEIESQIQTLNSSKNLYSTSVHHEVKSVDIISLVIDDIIELALETFVFEHTYLFLKPRSKVHLNVFFTKPVRIGSHHSYYDIEFLDSVTEELIMTKSVKVFSEILRHSIQVNPKILDMSLSKVTHGFCEDDIVVFNTHHCYPVTIKFNLTTKMRKMFCISPMESLVLPKSSMNFRIRLCSTDLSKHQSATFRNDLAHFTIKITIFGHKSIYNNVPPIFYEIIAPCASEFKKVYNDKYFNNTDMYDS